MTRVQAETGPLLLTPVHPPEIKRRNAPRIPAADLDDDMSLAETFRHSGWRHNRNLVYRALQRTLQSFSRRQAFSQCGAHAFVFRTLEKPYNYRLGGSSCHDRFCIPCARDRSRCLATNVLKVLADRQARFLTLTLKHRDEPLPETVDRLYDSFRKLRAHAFWKRHVTGGCAFLELKWSTRSEEWHVHLHALVHGRYVPRDDLRREWYKCTGDSFVVDVRFVKDQASVGRYVTKYVSKPVNDTFLNRRELLDEAVEATHNRRLALTFGDWRGIKLTESPEPGDWVNLGSFHGVVSDAVGGDAESLEAVWQICRESTEAVLATVRNARPPPPEQTPTECQLYFYWPGTLLRF